MNSTPRTAKVLSSFPTVAACGVNVPCSIFLIVSMEMPLAAFRDLRDQPSKALAARNCAGVIVRLFGSCCVVAGSVEHFIDAQIEEEPDNLVIVFPVYR